MNTEHIIHYYDKFGAIQKVKVSEVFEIWVNHNGGAKEFLRAFSETRSIDRLNIPYVFLAYFQEKFSAVLPEYDDPNFNDQDYIFNPELYFMYVRRLNSHYQDRVTNPHNIAFLVLVSLAILGLVSLCS